MVTCWKDHGVISQWVALSGNLVIRKVWSMPAC